MVSRIESIIHKYYNCNSSITSFENLENKQDVSQHLCDYANADDGEIGIIIVGLNANREIIGLKQKVRIIESELITLIDTIRPKIKPNFEWIFVPSKSVNIVIIKVTPTINRFFKPHEVIQDDLIEIGRLNNSSIYFTEKQLSDYAKSSKAKKIVFIMSLMPLISTHRRFLQLEKKIEFPYRRFGTLLRMLYIYLGKLNFSSVQSNLTVIEEIKHIFAINNRTKFTLNRIIIKSLVDLLVNNIGRFKNYITSTEEFSIFIHVMNLCQLKIDILDLLKMVEATPEILQYKRLNKSKKQFEPWMDESVSRIYDILYPIVIDYVLPKNSLLRKDKRERTSKLKERILQIDQISFPIDSDGRHARNYNLSGLVKEYYDFECQSCGSNNQSLSTITISHRIPLYFGVEFGGVDKSYNMEVLCRFCHDVYEKKFDENLVTINILTRKDLYVYLQSQFPSNKFLQGTYKEFN